MPAPPKWQFMLCKLNGEVIAEIVGASERTVTIPHNRIPTASFQVPLWHPIVSSLLSQDCLLKCYRRDTLGTNKLVFFGPILSIEENGSSEAQSIGVTATGPFWRLSKRVIGRNKAGWSYGHPGQAEDLTTDPDTPFIAQDLKDLGEIARAVLASANGEGFTGIDYNGATYQTSTNGAAGPWHLKPAAEAIAELSAGIGSFDWDVSPVEPSYPHGLDHPKIGNFNVYNRPKGVQRPDAIFEYGTQRANVSAYTRTSSRESILNRAIISLPGWPDGTDLAGDLIFRSDATSISARGLHEEVVSDAGVIDNGLREKIADEHVRYRKNPREIVVFTPAMNVRPQPFTDYEVGDWVRGRAVVRGTVRFDAMFRIWGAAFKLDQNGNETLDLTLVQE